MAGGSFFSELRKRKVLQAAAIYGAVAWGVTEIVVTVVEQLFLPQWVSTLAVIFFVVGFPVAMFLSWTFDITGGQIRRTEVSSRRGKASIALSVLLLITGTTGLFLLIKPTIDGVAPQRALPDILPNSIAILPFENVSQNAADDYLSEGLSNELRDQLGRIEDLRIAARSSSVSALKRGLDAIAASTSLRVAHLVEGSVRRQGNRLRVSVQLIEGRTGLSLWSETYDRGANEFLSVQQDIVEEVVRRVSPETETVVAKPATRNADANELMLLAHFYEQQVRDRQEVDVNKLLEAIALYQQAIEADPNSALAQSRLAGALIYSGDIEAAEAPIFKALSLDPNLSEVQNTLGEFYWARGRPEAATAFERAVELNPNNADALHNYANITWLTVAGHKAGIADTGQLFQRALELDPLSLSRHAAFGDYLGKEGRVDEVLLIIRRIQELFSDAEAHRIIAWLYELIGELDLAIAWTLKARNLESGNVDHNEYLASLYAKIGDVATANRLQPAPSIGLLFHMRRYDELIDAAEFHMIEEPEDIDVRYLLGFTYVATGQFEPAIYVLTSTGLPDTLLNDHPRSVGEIEAFFTLINALAGTNQPAAVATAKSLSERQFKGDYWWGDIGWIALHKSCLLAILERHDEALELIPRIKESARLRPAPLLYDSWCFRQYADSPIYQDVLRDQEARRTKLRARLPATLAQQGVRL